MLVESKKSQHIFNNDSLTFKQLKDIFNDVFGSYIVQVSRKVPMASAYVTNKDGDFYIAAVDKPAKLLKVDALKNIAKLDECDCAPANATMDDVITVLKQIDPILLNRYFANGKNMLKCQLVCPPNGCGDLYGDKCFVQFDGVDCFDGDAKCIGQDQKTSFELFKILKANECLANELGSMSAEQLNALSKCKSEKKVLGDILDALKALVDGIGWGCSLKYYIQDKYSRSIVNKALEHGLDVSKNGAFVNELVSRLSGTSSSRPTKSDLVTFAKREGIDCQSQEYKDFLNDIEANAESTNREVMAPIEDLVCYALQCAANNVLAMMALDPNPKAKKLLSQIDANAIGSSSSIEDCNFDASKLEGIKKALQKVCKYIELMPAEVRVMNGGKPYSVVGQVNKLQKLADLIG